MIYISVQLAPYPTPRKLDALKNSMLGKRSSINIEHLPADDDAVSQVKEAHAHLLTSGFSGRTTDGSHPTTPIGEMMET